MCKSLNQHRKFLHTLTKDFGPKVIFMERQQRYDKKYFGSTIKPCLWSRFVKNKEKVTSLLIVRKNKKKKGFCYLVSNFVGFIQKKKKINKFACMPR
jgi:hypothetical protein